MLTRIYFKFNFISFQFLIFFYQVLDLMVELMKEKDPLFSAIFQRVYGVGSYYDDLKVGEPEEFDVNVVVKLPVNYNQIVVSLLF